MQPAPKIVLLEATRYMNKEFEITKKGSQSFPRIF